MDLTIWASSGISIRLNAAAVFHLYCHLTDNHTLIMSGYCHNKVQEDYATGNDYNLPYAGLHYDLGVLTNDQIESNEDYKSWLGTRMRSSPR
jgi:hypothetical protein